MGAFIAFLGSASFGGISFCFWHRPSRQWCVTGVLLCYMCMLYYKCIGICFRCISLQTIYIVTVIHRAGVCYAIGVLIYKPYIYSYRHTPRARARACVYSLSRKKHCSVSIVSYSSLIVRMSPPSPARFPERSCFSFSFRAGLCWSRR